MKKKVNLLLDSGEFSAWRRGTSVDLKRYIAYCQENKGYLMAYVSVDKIPGKFGQPRTQKEVEESAKIGYDNLQKMHEAGLRPIPVFHQGERFHWLERMLADGEDYIGISSSKDLWANEQRKWLDDVFTLLTDSKGRPLVKTHGFGITRPAFIFRYPFYTCDSTAWSLAPGYGSILIPPLTNGVPDYLKQPIKIVLSGVQHKSPSSQKKQFEGLGPQTQEAIRVFLEDVVGVSIPEARYGTNIRRKAMLIYYLNLGNALTNVRFAERKPQSLLTTTKTINRKPTKFDHLHIMFATNLNKEWSTMMNELDCEDRLLSYWELKDKPSEVLQNYVKFGSHAEYEKKSPKTKWSGEAYRNHRRLNALGRFEAHLKRSEEPHATD
jgi:hypothetical protein